MTNTVKILCMVMALITAAGYFLMGAGVIHAADLTLKDAPPGFTWITGAFYIIAGVLLFLNKRWITITLTIINIIPIVVFYAMWASRTDVMFSSPGLTTKIGQILAEAGLIYLLIKSKKVQNIPEAT